MRKAIAYPMRYATNEQRRRRTLFKPTHWAVASWLMFLRCSLLTYRSRYARRSRLENQPTDPAAAGRYASYLGLDALEGLKNITINSLKELDMSELWQRSADKI